MADTEDRDVVLRRERGREDEALPDVGLHVPDDHDDGEWDDAFLEATRGDMRLVERAFDEIDRLAANGLAVSHLTLPIARLEVPNSRLGDCGVEVDRHGVATFFATLKHAPAARIETTLDRGTVNDLIAGPALDVERVGPAGP